MRASTGICFLVAFIGSVASGCKGTGSSKLLAPDMAAGGRFGTAVATTGSLGVIGSPGANGVGAAYVFDLGQNRHMVSQIRPDSATEGDDFGSALDLDDDVVAVGAPLHEHGGYIAGAVYVYHHASSPESFTREAVLVADSSSDLDYFGNSISVQKDLIGVGSPGDDGRGSNSGAAFVFKKADGSWSLKEKLSAPDGAPGDRCGSSVDVLGDRILVGCPHGFGSAIQSGAAYLFRRAGQNYVLEHKFIPPTKDVGQLFGSAVVLSSDRAFVGAPGPNAEHPDGSVHIFRFDGNDWQPDGVLSAGDRVASRGFGVVLNSDGKLLIVGAQRMEGEHPSPGSAYIFGLEGNSWVLQTKLTGGDIDRADGFGASVAVKDGRALVGAAGDAEGGSNAGAAYQFTQSGKKWK